MLRAVQDNYRHWVAEGAGGPGGPALDGRPGAPHPPGPSAHPSSKQGEKEGEEKDAAHRTHHHNQQPGGSGPRPTHTSPQVAVSAASARSEAGDSGAVVKARGLLKWSSLHLHQGHAAAAAAAALARARGSVDSAVEAGGRGNSVSGASSTTRSRAQAAPHEGGVAAREMSGIGRAMKRVVSFSHHYSFSGALPADGAADNV